MSRAGHGKALYECSPARITLPASVVTWKATPDGFAFTFADRVLPSWFMQLAHRLGMIPADADTYGKLADGRKARLDAPVEDTAKLRATFERELGTEQRNSF
jgi:hypothetical protein